MDWDAHLSSEGAARAPPELRAIVNRFSGIPGIITLHGGFPPGEAFPIASMSFTLRDGTKVNVDDPAKVRQRGRLRLFCLTNQAFDRFFLRGQGVVVVMQRCGRGIIFWAHAMYVR